MSEEQTKPRLIITKMVVENFKSYAGIREIGPFHESFTCVVGPNGSGKSNVIDAIQFVFGKRANKARAKKNSELIHNSENFPNCTSAKVTVFFNEITETTESDKYTYGKEFTVTRTVTKSNASAYFVNDKKSTFEDVQTLLKGKGIDLDNNRFLILQGEVEQISLMKPKGQKEDEDGLLEYIEDIIGTNQYKAKIAEQEKIVESTNEDRNEKLNRVKISESEKKALEPAKDEAEEFLNKKFQLAKHQVWKYQLEEEKLKKSTSSLKDLKDKTSKEHQAEAAKLNSAREKSRNIEKAYHEEKAEFDKIATKLIKEEKDFASFERSHVKLTQDLENVVKKLKTLEKDKESTEKKIEDDKRIISKSENDEKDGKSKLEKVRPELERAEYSVAELVKARQSEIDPLRIQMEKAQQSIAPFKIQVNEIQAKIDIAQGELDLVNRGSDTLAKKIVDSKDKIKEMGQEVETKKGTISDRREKIKKLNVEIPKLKDGIKQCGVMDTNFQGELDKAVSELQSAESTNNTNKSTSGVLKFLLGCKKDKSISGICDRLGALGTIDKKYDIAITSACPALQNMVVETSECGSKCVEALRSAKVGITTFLMIDKISKSVTRDKMEEGKYPEDVPRLFDLVKPKDEKYRVVFYQVLRDTLVAKDMDQATRIAFGTNGKRYRVVTLKGEMVEMSGVMSGGQKTPSRGGMSSTFAADEVSEERLQELKDEVAEAKRKLGEVRKAKPQMETALKAEESELEDCNDQIVKQELDIKSIETRKEDLKKRIKEYEHEFDTLKKDEKKIAELFKVIESHQKEKKKIEKTFANLEEEVAEITKKINEAGGDKLRMCKEKVEILKKEIREISSKITNCTVANEAAVNRIPKLEAQLIKIEGQEEETLKKRNQIEEDITELEGKAEEVVRALVAVKEAVSHKKDLVDQKSKEWETEKSKLSGFETLELELAAKLEDYEKELERSTKKLKDWSTKIDSIEASLANYSEFRPIEKLRATEAELRSIQEKDLDLEIGILETDCEKTTPNLTAIKEFKEKEVVYNNRVAELDKSTEIRNNAQKTYDELRKTRLDKFMKGFSTITMKLKEIYQMITLGGDAELELVDSLDPFSEGIIFSVRPPKKSWKNIANLSGGEKTLSSLALVFALHHFNPTPIYVMDEIDAALDFRNVSIIANYIKERTKNCAQFIVISLRNNMFELGDRLVGIYKTDNVTKTVCIDPKAVTDKMIKMKESNVVV